MRPFRRLEVCSFAVVLLFRLAIAGAQDADALYAQRAIPARAVEAAEIWRAQLKERPDDFESAWKLARATYWLGGTGAENVRRRWLEEGVAAGRTASESRPDRPEGHFWMAANMGALAESFGMSQGLKYRGDIKAALETVFRLDPGFLAGSPDRALGRWYFKVPRLFGGNKQRAEQHLRAALKYDPASTATHFFLAELFLDDGRRAEAIAELNAVIAAPLNPEWAPEDARFKERAQALLATVVR